MTTFDKFFQLHNNNSLPKIEEGQSWEPLLNAFGTKKHLFSDVYRFVDEDGDEHSKERICNLYEKCFDEFSSPEEYLAHIEQNRKESERMLREDGHITITIGKGSPDDPFGIEY